MLQSPSLNRCAVMNCTATSSSTSNATTTINTASTHTPDRVPALTPKECSLLVEHEGCFKCRRFYTTHKSADCPDGFPDKTSYVTLTDADALAAKKKYGKKEKTTTTAAVIPVPAAVVMPSAILGDGSDSEYVDAPFFVPHFFEGLQDVVLGAAPNGQHSPPTS